MIRVVGIDVSTWWGGLALVEASDAGVAPLLVAEVGLLVRDSHAVHLLVLLDRLLAEASWSNSSVDAYAATRGPGAFTGLRVGLGTIRGLGLASGRPGIGVGTLHAMAEAFGPSDRDRIPMMDAGRGDVYGGRYDASSSPPLEKIVPWVGPPEWILGAGAGEFVVFGPGARSHVGRLRSAGFTGRFGTSPTSVAAGAARIAVSCLLSGVAHGEGLAPLYVRPADVETGAPEASL